MFVMLSKNSFVRSYGDYGHIINQITNLDRLYNKSGKIFLEQITRKPLGKFNKYFIVTLVIKREIMLPLIVFFRYKNNKINIKAIFGLEYTISDHDYCLLCFYMRIKDKLHSY